MHSGILNETTTSPVPRHLVARRKLKSLTSGTRRNIGGHPLGLNRVNTLQLRYDSWPAFRPDLSPSTRLTPDMSLQPAPSPRANGISDRTLDCNHGLIPSVSLLDPSASNGAERVVRSWSPKIEFNRSPSADADPAAPAGCGRLVVACV